MYDVKYTIHSSLYTSTSYALRPLNKLLKGCHFTVSGISCITMPIYFGISTESTAYEWGYRNNEIYFCQIIGI